MNQEFHDHLDVCVQCRTHPMSLCANGVRLLYNQAMAAPRELPRTSELLGTCGNKLMSAALVERAKPLDARAQGDEMAADFIRKVPTAVVNRDILGAWFHSAMGVGGDIVRAELAQSPAVAVRAQESGMPVEKQELLDEINRQHGQELDEVFAVRAQAQEPLEVLIANWRKESEHWRQEAATIKRHNWPAGDFQRGASSALAGAAEQLKAVLRSLRSDREREAKQ